MAYKTHNDPPHVSILMNLSTSYTTMNNPNLYNPSMSSNNNPSSPVSACVANSITMLQTLSPLSNLDH